MYVLLPIFLNIMCATIELVYFNIIYLSTFNYYNVY